LVVAALFEPMATFIPLVVPVFLMRK
jgi:hypothetical protein